MSDFDSSSDGAASAASVETVDTGSNVETLASLQGVDVNAAPPAAAEPVINTDGSSAEPAPKIDSEVEKFALSLGYDKEDLMNPRIVKGIEKMHGVERSSAEFRTKSEELTRKIAERDAADYMRSLETAKTAVAGPSPVAAIDTMYRDAIQGLADINGVDVNDPEFKSSPQFQRLANAWNAERNDALPKEIEWHSQKGAVDRTESENASRAAAEAAASMKQAQDILAEFERTDPELKQKMVNTGVVAHIQSVSDRLGIPVEKLLADREFVEFYVSAAQQRHDASRMPEILEGNKQEVLKNLNASRGAQLPSTGNRLPGVLKTLSNAGAQNGRGKKLLI